MTFEMASVMANKIDIMLHIHNILKVAKDKNKNNNNKEIVSLPLLKV